MTVWPWRRSARFLMGFGLIAVLFLSACSPFRSTVIDHQNKTINWSGREWYVKESTKEQGPGPNYFSSSAESVWVDDSGNLHLTITKKGDKWYCSEIISKDFVSYGKYSIESASRIDQLDPNVVLGFFTWRPRGGRDHNEIDIEFSRWGKPSSTNAQFVVQPYTNYNHIHRFNFTQSGDFTTHEFLWLPYSIFFRSYHGHYAEEEGIPVIDSWHSTNARVPVAKKTQIRLNLWLFDSNGPTNKENLEVVIKRFKYDSLSELK